MGVEWKILRRVCARNSTPIGHGPSSVGQDWVTVHCGVLLRNKIRSIVTKRGEYSTRVNEGDSTYGQSVENLGGFFRPEVSSLPRESKPLVVQIIFYNRFEFSSCCPIGILLFGKIMIMVLIYLPFIIPRIYFLNTRWRDYLLIIINSSIIFKYRLIIFKF